MKKRNRIIIVLLVVSIFVFGWLIAPRLFIFKAAVKGGIEAAKEIYYCAMHPDFISQRPGNCLICGMSLVKKTASPGVTKTGNKIIYYRNPMDLAVISPVPMKDQMGMDYIPVYEEQQITAQGAGVYISPEKQQLIGVKTLAVRKQRLNYQISTVGKVAYDPGLYVAQEEYLQAIAAQKGTQGSDLELVKGQAESFVEAARKKLMLLGMGEEEIRELARQNKAQANLYLPLNGKTVWVYMTIYEYEIDSIKPGLPVEVEAIAFPGKIFTGRIVSLVPVLEAMTRSVQARAEISDPDHLLKPQMFVNTRINVDLGEKLSVPEEAVLDTGERRIVFVAKPNGYFTSRNVKLGAKAKDYYEVAEGLSEGEVVVTSGNFLIDSESKLKSALSHD